MASSPQGDRQSGEGMRRNPRQAPHETSSEAIVPKKAGNRRVTPREPLEGRAEANGNAVPRDVCRTQDREEHTNHPEERIGQRATQFHPGKFTNLLSHLKVPLLRRAYLQLNRRAASGIDGESWNQFGQQLEERLADLQDRIQRGGYRPPAVRRTYTRKQDGKQRPLGIPTVEDKVAQQAVRMLLEPIYEKRFFGFSYGYRPGKSQHDALDALAVAIGRRVNFILDADIKSFFDTIEHDVMRRFLEEEIGDARLLRLLMKWLKAGVMEEGKLHDVTQGTPQGGVISPLLANIYLHYAFDRWAHPWRERARGEIYIVRYADDIVMGFQHEKEARQFLADMTRRLADLGLTLHGEKTHLLHFGRYAKQRTEERGCQLLTFDFLGFTHVSTWQGEAFHLRRISSVKKRKAKMVALKAELRVRRHHPPGETYRWLCSVVRGLDAYFGVPGNEGSMKAYRKSLRENWYHQLRRRSDKARLRKADRERLNARYPLPPLKLHHPWPEQRWRGR